MWPFSVLCCLVTRGDCTDNSQVAVKVEPESVTAPPGANLTFTCRYDVPQHAPYVKVQWQKYHASHLSKLLWTARFEHTKTEDKLSDTSGYDTTRLHGSPATLPGIRTQHTLTFLSIQKEDTGEYYCSVTYRQGNDHTYEGSSSFNVTVEGNYLTTK